MVSIPARSCCFHPDHGHMKTAGSSVTPFLFPCPRRPGQPSSSVARNLLRAICARIRPTPRFTPHQFRHFLVNTLIRQGNRLECVARWLGHRSPAVTYRHYWTEVEIPLLRNGAEKEKEAEDGNDESMLFVALEHAVEECERLRGRVATLEGTAEKK